MGPKMSALRELEYLTLERIDRIPEFGKLPNLRVAAKDALRTLNRYAGQVDVRLGFKLDVRLKTRLKRPEKQKWVEIGARVIQGTGDSIRDASYSLVICKEDSPRNSAILRKLHIDYEHINQRNTSEPKPTIHMQWCGKFSAEQKADGFDEKKIGGFYPGLEKPRLPVAPTTIAVMLNWLLLEFQVDSAAQAILKSDDWRSLVVKAEREILKPYYMASAAFLGATAQEKRRFLQCFQYEMGGN